MRTTGTVEFTPFRLDLGDESLWRHGERVHVTPKAFAVLRYLVAYAGQLVTRDALFEVLWPETYVSEDALTVCIRELRQVLGDRVQSPQYIETVRGRGYRFIAPAIAPSQEMMSSWRGGTASPPVLEQQLIVERDRELAILHDQLDAMLRGQRQLVFISGEAGIGKTTLVDAFVAQVGTRTPLWVGRGQCIDHYGTGEAYLPLLDALGQLGRGPDGERVISVLRQQAPSWLLYMPALVSSSEFNALEQRSRGTTQARMLRELAEAVEAVTLEQPLVLVLEDLHWSDHATLDWLAFVARRRTPARLLVLGTYRPVDAIVRAHPVNPIAHELQRQATSVELVLDYLSATGVMAYLSHRLGESALPAGLVQLLHQRTNGNPFFLATIVDEWIRHGVMEESPEGWTFQRALESTPVEIPDSIKHLIEQQLGTLSFEDRELLEQASVAGAEFSAAMLGGKTAAEQVDDQCAALASRGQFVKTQGIVTWPDGTVTGSYRFIHALYQDTLYNEISVSRRARLHQQIGRRLEAGYGEQARERAAELARHFEQGGDFPRAVPYLQHAGAEAIARSAQREAVHWYERALQLLEHLPETSETRAQTIDVHLALRTAFIPLAENTKSFAHLRAAASLAESLGDHRRQGYIDAYLTREWFSMSDYDRALEAGHRALAKAHNDDAFRISTQLYLSYVYRGIGAYQCIVELLEPVVATLTSPQSSERFGLATLPAVSLRFSLISALTELGQFAEGAAHGAEAIRIAEANGHVFGLYQAYRGLGSLLLQRGHIESALPLLERSHALCVQAGMSGSLAVTSSRLGMAYVHAGRLSEGLQLLEQGVEKKVTSHPDYALRLVLLGEGYGYAGRLVEALVLAHEALDMARSRRERGTAAYAQHLLGRLAAHDPASDSAQAAAWYHQARALANELRMRPLQAHCYHSLGKLYRQHRHIEQALTELSQAVELYRRMDMTFWLRQAEAAQLGPIPAFVSPEAK